MNFFLFRSSFLIFQPIFHSKPQFSVIHTSNTTAKFYIFFTFNLRKEHHGCKAAAGVLLHLMLTVDQPKGLGKLHNRQRNKNQAQPLGVEDPRQPNQAKGS